jgi:hypothetical protein
MIDCILILLHLVTVVNRSASVSNWNQKTPLTVVDRILPLIPLEDPGEPGLQSH